MLADEVTHVKMGSDWLRRLTDERPRAPRSGPSSSSGSSTSCSPTAGSGATTTTARSAWPAGSASWPASTRPRSTRSAPLAREAADERKAAASGPPAQRRGDLMAVTVTPADVHLVNFDAADIAADRRAAPRRDRPARRTSRSASRSTRQSPTGRVQHRRRSSRCVVTVESGAFENPKKLRIAERGKRRRRARRVLLAGRRPARPGLRGAEPRRRHLPCSPCGLGCHRRRPAGPARSPGPAAATALPLPQPPRVHRRGRRRVRQPVVGPTAGHVGRAGGRVRRTVAARRRRPSCPGTGVRCPCSRT